MFGQMYRALPRGSTAPITAEVSLGELNTLIPLTELDGTVLGLMSWDTATPNPVCQEVVDYYTKKYGKWDDPSFDIDTFYAFKAALFAAGAADNDKMAAALGSGLAFDGPHGASKMIPRADAGVADRTVCLIMEYARRHFQGGQAIPLQDGIPRRLEKRPHHLAAPSLIEAVQPTRRASLGPSRGPRDRNHSARMTQ
jgi:hypothetical protein